MSLFQVSECDANRVLGRDWPSGLISQEVFQPKIDSIWKHRVRTIENHEKPILFRDSWVK